MRALEKDIGQRGVVEMPRVLLSAAGHSGQAYPFVAPEAGVS